MTAPWQPHRESVRTTLLRTVAIALIVGAVLARSWGGLARWPVASVVALWLSLGGHFVELWFLNWLRPQLRPDRLVQLVTRLSVWFVGGCLLMTGMQLTRWALTGAAPSWQLWWLGGVSFICIELIVHLLLLQLRGKPSVYNGRG